MYLYTGILRKVLKGDLTFKESKVVCDLLKKTNGLLAMKSIPSGADISFITTPVAEAASVPFSPTLINTL